MLWGWAIINLFLVDCFWLFVCDEKLFVLNNDDLSFALVFWVTSNSRSPENRQIDKIAGLFCHSAETIHTAGVTKLAAEGLAKLYVQSPRCAWSDEPYLTVLPRFVLYVGAGGTFLRDVL